MVLPKRSRFSWPSRPSDPLLVDVGTTPLAGSLVSERFRTVHVFVVPSANQQCRDDVAYFSAGRRDHAISQITYMVQVIG